MTGSIRFPKAPLERGSISAGGYRSLAVGSAAEIMVGIPSGVLGVMSQARQVTGTPPLEMLKTASSVLGWAGSGFATYSAWQEGSGVRQEWARVRRRGRLGMSRGAQVMTLLAGGSMAAARGISGVLPLANAVGFLESTPIGPFVSAFISTVKVVRTAGDLATAARFAGLVSVVKHKKGGTPADPTLTVLDRLRGEVAHVVESVSRAVASRLRSFPSAEREAQLLSDAHDEIFCVLQDRVGTAAAAKLIALAKENSSSPVEALDNEMPDHRDPVAKLRAGFDGIQNLYDFLLSPQGRLRNSEHRDLADALIHALRQDASLFKKQSVLRLCLAVASFLGALIGLAALFTPAGPVLLLIKAGIGLSVSLITLAQLPWDIRGKRSADPQPLVTRVKNLADDPAGVGIPSHRPRSIEANEQALAGAGRKRPPHRPRDLVQPEVLGPAAYA